MENILKNNNQELDKKNQKKKTFFVIGIIFLLTNIGINLFLLGGSIILSSGGGYDTISYLEIFMGIAILAFILSFFVLMRINITKFILAILFLVALNVSYYSLHLVNDSFAFNAIMGYFFLNAFLFLGLYLVYFSSKESNRVLRKILFAISVIVLVLGISFYGYSAIKDRNENTKMRQQNQLEQQKAKNKVTEDQQNNQNTSSQIINQ